MVTKDQFKEDKTLKKELFYLSSYVQKKVFYIYVCVRILAKIPECIGDYAMVAKIKKSHL